MTAGLGGTAIASDDLAGTRRDAREVGLEVGLEVGRRAADATETIAVLEHRVDLDLDLDRGRDLAVVLVAIHLAGDR